MCFFFSFQGVYSPFKTIRKLMEHQILEFYPSAPASTSDGFSQKMRNKLETEMTK